LKKAIYKPTKQNTVILNEFEEYCEILLDGEYKTVSRNDLEFIASQTQLSTFEELKENIFINCIKNPLSDILYSYNTNRLTPEPHQYKPLIKFLNSENNRVLIADEVGLGKTIEAGMIFKEIDKREELKISLIVVPSSLTLKWQEELNIRFDEYFEIQKTNQFLNFINEVENSGNSRLINEKIIISYHTLRDERVMKSIKNSFFEVDFLIMDEAHTMRNYGTSTFESAELITSISEHIVFLTATPVQNSLNDLFNVLSLLDGDYFKDYDYFQKMLIPNKVIHKLIALIRNNHTLQEIKSFINASDNENYPTILKDIFSDILKLQTLQNLEKIDFIDRLIKSDHLSFIINRTKKKDVGRSIPRSAKSVIVEITNEEQEYYDAVIELVKFLNPDTPQGFITIMPERMASSSMIASLDSFKEIKKSGKLFIKDIDDLEDYYEDIDIRQEALKYLDDIIMKGKLIGDDDSKYLRFEEILKDLKSQNIKQMIVFSFFKKTLNYLEIKLQNMGYSVGKIHGDFSVEERFAKIKEFKKGNFDILLSSEVGSEGLDMQFCNVVINYDLPWNPMRVEQRIGRIDRIGQKFDKLHIFNLCIVGSIEDRILNRLYTKLDIFENSVGELEPILGELEKQLNISELIHLSQEEIDEKIHLKELAIRREEVEIKEQNSEVEKLINEDIHYKSKHDELLNPIKINALQEQSKKIFVNYLEENKINYFELKDGDIKLSSENFKKLFNLLKANISDKRTQALQYKEERAVLQKINRYKELKVSFITNNNDEFQTLYLYLNNPIISIITRDKIHKTIYSIVSSDKYKDNYAVVYRVNFKQMKNKSVIRTIVFDKNLALIDEIDYFEFINECSHTETTININLEEIKTKSTTLIIKSIEEQKVIEAINQNRQIDIKINSINNYFDKQMEKVKRLEQKLSNEDVKRMRIGEIENLKIQKEKKIQELENQKEIKSSFEVLGCLEIVV
jgi:superfamily II DNA or RNA helicase